LTGDESASYIASAESMMLAREIILAANRSETNAAGKEKPCGTQTFR
jgi:hypothetical protein